MILILNGSSRHPQVLIVGGGAQLVQYELTMKKALKPTQSKKKLCDGLEMVRRGKQSRRATGSDHEERISMKARLGWWAVP